MELEKILDEIRRGKNRGLAEAITHVENRTEKGREIIKEIYKETGNSHIIGITGFPGVGKSSLISLISEKYRGEGKTVGIVGTDPSSPFTGGALLGDRLRLSGHDTGSNLWDDPGLFYRSVSTGGRAGGIAQTTGDIITLLDAAGFDKVLVETAGAGQSEVDMVKVVDTSIVVLMPSVGDRVQFGKAGILEIADIFVVNKSDLSGASETERYMKEMLSIQSDIEGFESSRESQSSEGHHKGSSKYTLPEVESDEDSRPWLPRIVRTVAKQGEEKGIEELIQAIDSHKQFIDKTGHLEDNRRKRARRELESVLFDLFCDYCGCTPDLNLEKWVEEVAAKEIDPYTAAEEILKQITRS